MELNIFLAFAAGFISFLSPCIFPLIPSYIGYIGAATYNEGFKRTREAIPLILSFIGGFTIVFSLMGIAFSTLGIAFKGYSEIITRVSGIIVVILGLNFIFSFLKFLDFEKKIEFRSDRKGVISSLLLGLAFGAGWSPCIGPILASILFLAGNQSTQLNGAILLLFFSLGLGIPFLISGLFISKFREKSEIIRRNMGKIKVLSGILIIIIGVLIFFNKLDNINILLYKSADSFLKWYSEQRLLFNISVGLVSILLSLVVSIRALRKKTWNFLHIILLSILLILATGSFTGFINWGRIIESYLTFQGI